VLVLRCFPYWLPGPMCFRFFFKKASFQRGEVCVRFRPLGRAYIFKMGIVSCLLCRRRFSQVLAGLPFVIRGCGSRVMFLRLSLTFECVPAIAPGVILFYFSCCFCSIRFNIFIWIARKPSDFLWKGYGLVRSDLMKRIYQVVFRYF